LINILASLRRMAIGFGLAVVVSIPLGLMMGAAAGGIVFQSAADGYLSGTEGGADADHHALARCRRRREDAGDFLGVSLPVIYHSFQGAKAVEEKMLWSGLRWACRRRSA